jgi:hypothetical protein
VGVSENTKKVCKFNEIERKTSILDTKISFKSFIIVTTFIGCGGGDKTQAVLTI